jgi:hypothetical protein
MNKWTPIPMEYAQLKDTCLEDVYCIGTYDPAVFVWWTVLTLYWSLTKCLTHAYRYTRKLNLQTNCNTDTEHQNYLKFDNCTGRCDAGKETWSLHYTYTFYKKQAMHLVSSFTVNWMVVPITSFAVSGSRNIVSVTDVTVLLDQSDPVTSGQHI